MISLQGCIIWDNVRLADTPWARLRGLLGRRILMPGEGLVLTPCNQVHGLFMNFPIDLVFLDRERRVIQICRLDPWQISPYVRKAQSVLEVPAGSAEGRVRPGDQLELAPSASGGTQQ
ncbi:MAG: DUF192 domain-containing protein [Eubacteriales bacterium]|nr:DUF192 domain-containing protein [Eubacteriales bacterium]